MVLQDQPNDQNEECCSYTSSNRESWGRCSSLGGSDEESSADCTAADNRHQVSLSLSLSTLHIPVETYFLPTPLKVLFKCYAFIGLISVNSGGNLFGFYLDC